MSMCCESTTVTPLKIKFLLPESMPATTSNGKQSSCSIAVCNNKPRECNNDCTQQKNEEQNNYKASTETSDIRSVDITFENIAYTVSLGQKDGHKQILRGLNGRFASGQLIGLLGPSGAGKSTLLDILSGYRLSGVRGSICVNALPRDLQSFRRSSVYITQDDHLEPLLTVVESMRIAADLKISTDVSKEEKETIIEEILSSLGLKEHANTRAGRLSGGQKKRLSIALELVNDPTVLFLDEPTTGLDSSSSAQVINVLKVLARQGRTIICTIHQPSATIFQILDQIYVLAKGECLYQGATRNLVPYLQSVELPCPMYHNPADYVIELASGEHGEDKIQTLVKSTKNGKNLKWMDKLGVLLNVNALYSMETLPEFRKDESQSLQVNTAWNQFSVLLKRGYIKTKRDQAFSLLRIVANIFVGLMFGILFIGAGNDANQVLNNFNLLFSCLIHLMMTTMMLTVLTFPSELRVLQKEHFNRWYSLKAYYTSTMIIDLPVSVLCCFLFTTIVYFMSGQPCDIIRFSMFFVISLLVMFVAQSFGWLVGSCCNVVNGTFVAVVKSVPMMMFAGFGVSIPDLPSHFYWGTYISYLRYGLEGYVHAIYGMNRPNFECTGDDSEIIFCYWTSPKKFVKDRVAMEVDRFWIDVGALCCITFTLRIATYFLLRWKLKLSR